MTALFRRTKIHDQVPTLALLLIVSLWDTNKAFSSRPQTYEVIRIES